MTTGRFNRRPPKPPSQLRAVAPSEQLFLGAILAGSLLLHLVVGAIVLSGINFGRFKRTPLVTMRVDLVSAPVLAPKRGEGGTVAVKALPTPAVKPVAPPAAKPHEVLVPDKSKKPVKPQAKPKDNDEADLRKSLAEMRQRQKDKEELDNAADAIAQMRKTAAKAKQVTPPKAVAGSLAGTGTESGSGIEAWLYRELRSNWQLSKDQIHKRELQARVEIELDVQGKLVNYKFIELSKEQAFNDSLRRAILKLKPLPKELRKPWRDTILFTLDDLQGN